jgi:hypothetical protein
VNDDELQRAYARSITTPPDRAGCPGPEAIGDLVARKGTEPARLEVLDHVMSCAECRRDLDLLLVADRAGARSALAPRWLAGAAAAILVIGVAAVGARTLLRERAAEVERGGAPPLALTPERGAVASRPVTLRWHAVSGGREYRVELLAADGAPRWTATTSDSFAVVPDSAVARDGEYGWWVTARLADGSSIRSAVVPFSVR